jgi:ubiquinone/menaquinone biosynthesis C-methylase UbiE
MVSISRPRLPLADRAHAPELLDSGDLAPADVETNLADLARMNRLPGGTGTSIAAIERLVRGVESPTIVDVGTGRADMPVAFARRGWRCVAVDSNPEVLRIARAATRASASVEVVEAHAEHLPLPDGGVDVAHSSLLIHHLDPAEAITVLAEMARVARRGVVVNDLRRGVLPLAITAATVMVFGRTHVTRTDGIASARRSYTLRELDDLLDAAGLRRTWRSPALMPRVVTLAVPR